MSNKRRDSKGRVLREGEFQRADGRYMFRYTDGSGERRTVYSWQLVDTDAVPSGKRKSKALRSIEKDISKDIDDNIHSWEASHTTFDELFETFISLRVDLKENTVVNYRMLYQSHVKDEIGRRKASTIKFSDIQKLYISLMETKKLKPSTVQKINAIIYQAFDVAVQDNIIRLNPATGVYKTLSRMYSMSKEKRHALSIDEQEAFIRYVYQSTKYQKYGPLFTVLLGTGMRIGEALGLRWCDCDFRRKVIHVTHAIYYKQGLSGKCEYHISTPKTKAGNRDIPMLEDVKDALLSLREGRKDVNNEFVVDGYSGFIFINTFGNVYSPTFICGIMKDIISDHNRDEKLMEQSDGKTPLYLPVFSPHILRHTFCTRLYELEPNLKVVQEVMGHKDYKTTMDIYNEATAQKKQQSFDSFNGKMVIR